MGGRGNSTFDVRSSGDGRIDGLLSEAAWSGGRLGYSFPAQQFDFGNYGSGEAKGMYQASGLMQTAVHFALDSDSGPTAGFSVQGFTALDVVLTEPEYAQIRITQTTEDPYNYYTAWGYGPSELASGGDVWLSDRMFDYSAPRPGGYAFTTLMHELGHALGLEHGHSETRFGALPADMDSMEYSLMTYRSYIGAPGKSYTNEVWGFAQSWMMLDIAALQYLYGADFTANSGDTVYSWTPFSGDTLVDGAVAIAAGANRIFATIWDGDGTDTYDLSAYDTDLSIDLAPGGVSAFDAVQVATLGTGIRAQGNIYNALQYQGDARSLIENAIGGSGNDHLAGNLADNLISAGGGDDTIVGREGDDFLRGQIGDDTVSGDDGRDRMQGGQGDDILFGDAGRDWIRGGAGDDTITGGAGSDRLLGLAGSDTFRFVSASDSTIRPGPADRVMDFEIGIDRLDLSALIDGTLELDLAGGGAPGAPSVRVDAVGADSRVMIDIDGDGEADMRIDLIGALGLTAADFLL